MPNLTNLATTGALTAIENKIPSISSLVKKTDYNIKINEIEKKSTDHNHDKYITTSEFNKFTKDILDLRLKWANVAIKTDMANFNNDTDFDNKVKDVTWNKNGLNELSKKVIAMSAKGLTKVLIDKFSILYGEKCFSSGIFLNHFVSIPAIKYIKYFYGTAQVYS